MSRVRRFIRAGTADGLRPGINTGTELNEGFRARFLLASTAARALLNSSEASLTKYMRL